MALHVAMKRRAFIVSAGATLAGAALPLSAQRITPIQDITPFVNKVTGGAPIERRGVEVELPALAENGNSVPLRVRVESPMTDTDHVSAIHVFAERNPRPQLAVFRFGPAAGRALVDTRVRLAGTQKVTVLASLSGGRFRMAQVDVVVTSAACLDDSSQPT